MKIAWVLRHHSITTSVAVPNSRRGGRALHAPGGDFVLRVHAPACILRQAPP